MRRLPRWSLLPMALIVAGISCNLPGRRPPVVPTQSFSTATPGGSVSVSLRTPTAVDDLSVATLDSDQTTPIGPVATATAFARASTAATATANALQSQVFNQPATCPEVGNPAAPSRPQTFAEYPEVVAEYLSLGGPATVLEATLRSWGAVSERGGLVRADRDFNADGVAEVLLVLLDPGSTSLRPGGEVMLFACSDAVYRLIFRSGFTPGQSAPVIVSADDLIGIGYNHMVFVTETCDTQTCTKNVHIVGWNIRLGLFTDMTERAIIVPGSLAEGLGVLVTDTTNDGQSEIIISGGETTSAVAGPSRAVTEIWAWDGQNYSLSETIVSDTTYRVHVLHDADAALARGQFDLAAENYTRVLEDGTLQSWTLPFEIEYLRAFALYRLMLTNSIQYEQVSATSYYDELLSRYPVAGQPSPSSEDGQPGPNPGGPGSIYTEVATIFWNSFNVSGDHGIACQAAISFAQTRPEVLGPLNSFGYANRQYTADNICPFVTQQANQ